MRRVLCAAAVLGAFLWSSGAWAVIGDTTVSAESGGQPIPEAKITVTFKDNAGKPIRTVTRTTARTGKRTFTIPDNTAKVDISVTTANRKEERRADIDVAQLTNKEIVIDIPGGQGPSRPRPPGTPDQPAPAFPDGPGGFIVGFGAGGQTTACNNWKTTRIVSLDVLDPMGEAPEACFSSAFRGSIYAGFSTRVMSNWLAGIEGDFGYVSSKKSIMGIPGSVGGVPGVTPAVAANDGVTVEKTWDASVRGRFGYFVTPKVAVYGTAGIAFQQIEATVRCGAAGACGVNAIPPFAATNSSTLVGWTAGGGVETAVTDNVVVRVEYRYSDYGTYTSTFGVPANLAVTSDIDLRTHTALVGVALRLGR